MRPGASSSKRPFVPIAKTEPATIIAPAMASVPVIDINELCRADTLAALDAACRDWGLFQVTNHGVSADIIADLFAEARAFFALPTATKRSISRSKANPWGFYDQELTRRVRDLKQVFDFGPADGVALEPQFPDELPGFRPAVERCYQSCERLAMRLLTAIAKNLGLPADAVRRGFGDDHTSFLRLNYYPVIGEDRKPSGSDLGVNPHTDAGALTLLLQDTEPGLQVYRAGTWHTIEPRQDAVVVNIGDIVQVWSNDGYTAALHRAVASVARPRFSIPFFLNPAFSMNYAPLSSMVSANKPARYKTINWGEFRARRADGDYADYGAEVQISDYRMSD